jgi:tetratricopeptide (TPR) repeat protein
MRMRNFLLGLVFVSLVFSPQSPGQGFTYGFTLQSPEDPAYALYREGYNLVLQGSWKEAQKKFDEVLRHHPKSSYRDDASYWRAYCLKYWDEKKAVESLKRFLKEYPTSSYRSDALEDLAEIQTRIQTNILVVQDSLLRHRVHVQVPQIDIDIPEIHFYPNWDADFPPSDRIAVRVFTDEMQEEMEWAFGSWTRSGRDRKLDENTRLKISALRGIAADQDAESFKTVRDILLDRSENARLREEALRLFSRFRKFDLLPTLFDVAKSDPERHLRTGAIYYIGRYDKDKEGATGTLIRLFSATPKDSTRLREGLLYSIARTRSDTGMDFLVNVAKSDEDYNLREAALYWLGKYGEGSKKKALYEILKRR